MKYYIKNETLNQCGTVALSALDASLTLKRVQECMPQYRFSLVPKEEAKGKTNKKGNMLWD